MKKQLGASLSGPRVERVMECQRKALCGMGREQHPDTSASSWESQEAWGQPGAFLPLQMGPGA